MAVIPIPEIEAELLARGVLIKQFLRDPQKPQQGPSSPLLLVDGLPQSRTTTRGLGRWVGEYLSPDAVAMVAGLPKHLQWEAVRDEVLTNEQLIDLAHRLGIGYKPPELGPDVLLDEELFKDWWIDQAKQVFKKAA
jgi:hypothetical protein